MASLKPHCTDLATTTAVTVAPSLASAADSHRNWPSSRTVQEERDEAAVGFLSRLVSSRRLLRGAAWVPLRASHQKSEERVVSDVAYLELDSFEPITSHQDTFLWTYMSLTQDNSLLARPNRPQLGRMRPSCTLPVLTPDHVMATFWRIDNSGCAKVGD